MSFQDPRTASPENSIWCDLPEDEFRQHLVALEESTNTIPMDPQVFSAQAWLLATDVSSLTLNASSPPSGSESVSTSLSVSESQRILPITIEQEVADDFACLAAVVEGGQSVAAVCIEQHRSPGGEPGSCGMTLRFAAVDLTLNEKVKNALQAIASILANAASVSSSGQNTPNQCVELLYDQVIKLHHHRLLARLRSTKWEKPKYLLKSHKKPLWQDFPNLLHRLQFAYTKQEKVLRKLVEDQLSQLSRVYAEFETSPKRDDLSTLQNLVDSSLRFCSAREIKDYLHRLQTQTSQNPPTPQIGAAVKSLRQIQKIAAYRRMSVFLVSTAKKYPALFSKIDIAYLCPYASIPTSVGHHEWAKTCHVHAEVQLAVYYDTLSRRNCTNSDSTLDSTLGTRPRIIGTSKWLCYLCYQFLCAHGSFFPSKTHGQLYDQWTLPDLREFDSCEGMVKRYRKILKDIDEVVLGQIKEDPELLRLKPMTSCTLE